jgi:integrase
MYEGHRLNYLRVSTAADQRALAEAKMPEKSKRKEQQNHKLRSVCTSAFMLCGGIHPKVVQELLGHASVTITLDTYSHVLPSMQGEAAEKINSMLS